MCIRSARNKNEIKSSEYKEDNVHYINGRETQNYRSISTWYLNITNTEHETKQECLQKTSLIRKHKQSFERTTLITCQQDQIISL